MGVNCVGSKWIGVLALSLSVLFVSADENKLNQVMEGQIQNHQQAVQSQKKVSQLADKTRDLVHDYRQTLREIDNLRAYNAQLKQLIADQEQERTSIYEQIQEVKKTRTEIVPFMLEMYSTLEEFVRLDVPFLKKERQKRLVDIKQIMNRSDVSVSEKYRRLMEAYQIENDYGNSLEAYQGIETIDGKELSVNYLRVGRLAFIYQTLDGKRQAYWDHKNKEWKPLSSRYRRDVENGLKIARNQQAPDLLTVPIPAPVKTQIKL